MSVIIIESPNKIKKIQEITGDKVFATVGHFRMQLVCKSGFATAKLQVALWN